MFAVVMCVKKELTLTSVENCRLISTRKISKRLIKSGKHNLLNNSQHRLSFLRNQNADEATQKTQRREKCFVFAIVKGDSLNHLNSQKRVE